MTTTFETSIRKLDRKNESLSVQRLLSLALLQGDADDVRAALLAGAKADSIYDGQTMPILAASRLINDLRRKQEPMRPAVRRFFSNLLLLAVNGNIDLRQQKNSAGFTLEAHIQQCDIELMQSLNSGRAFSELIDIINKLRGQAHGFTIGERSTTIDDAVIHGMAVKASAMESR